MIAPNTLKHITVLALLLFSAFAGYTQEQTPKQPAIRLTGKNTGDKVILRWVPDTPGVWSLSNTYGYNVERLAFTDEEDFLNVGYELLTPSPLKPWPLEQWRAIAEKDDFAAAAAQVIYGERGALKPGSTGFSIFEKADEFKNLFSTAILSAEFSVQAATASGLRYEDNNISSDKTYLYRVYSLGNSSQYPIDTAYWVVKGSEVGQEPTMSVDKTIELENAVELQWDRFIYEQQFSAYYIERSVDGANFTRINSRPFIDSPYEGSEISAQWISFVDSVENYKPYYYRVIGLTTFGELSKPSEAVKAMGRDRTPPKSPVNVMAEQIAPSQMKISWEVESGDYDISGFMIARGNSPDDQPVNLIPEGLPADARSYIDDSYDELVNNWYYVGVMDTASNASVSFPVHGTVIDSLPPAPPQNLVGKIDSSGIVKIHWNIGKERDLKGYMVFYTNQADHVYANISNRIIMDTVFTDTVNVKVLTKEIYYKIVAVDAYYNHSDYSEVLVLEKPDVIPPVAPVFTDYKISEEGIKLTWAQSSSSDVESHQLYRREKGSLDWTMIKTFNTFQTYQTFLDEDLETGKTYEYNIKAIDSSGLVSPVSFTLTLRAIDFSQKPKVTRLTAQADVEKKEVQIKWVYPIKGKYHFRLYRAVDGGGFTILQQLEKSKLKFTDKKVKAKRQYEYAIKVVYEDGKDSGFGEIEKASFE